MGNLLHYNLLIIIVVMYVVVSVVSSKRGEGLLGVADPRFCQSGRFLPLPPQNPLHLLHGLSEVLGE